MANDADWVEDVRRWCLAATQPRAPVPAQTDDPDMTELGYEAAQPALQARYWPDMPVSGSDDLT
jgi:hypothetical protein